MKRVTLALIAIACMFSFASAQMIPAQGDMGIGFKVTGLANVSFNNWSSSSFDNLTVPHILFRYYLADNLALRVQLGLQSYNNTTTYGDSTFTSGYAGEFTTGDSSESQFGFAIAPGIEYHFGSDASRIDPYAGGQIGIAMTGSRNVEMNETTTASGYTSSMSTTAEYDGGFSFSIAGLIGFNYFFNDNIAIGGEYMLGFGSTKNGGDYSGTSTFSLNDSNIPVSSSGSASFAGSLENKQSGIFTTSTAGVNLSVFW